MKLFLIGSVTASTQVIDASLACLTRFNKMRGDSVHSVLVLLSFFSLSSSSLSSLVAFTSSSKIN